MDLDVAARKISACRIAVTQLDEELVVRPDWSVVVNIHGEVHFRALLDQLAAPRQRGVVSTDGDAGKFSGAKGNAAGGVIIGKVPLRFTLFVVAAVQTELRIATRGGNGADAIDRIASDRRS